ncbi:hypothetical protein [Actinocorallia populi]|uniref:hypothetical protein n=1 Tax=Actinocorallia populi TaxID=2079200 RepID=UPI000D08B3A9|nr:hypothetical protein [Actinocorallia populi]
MTDSIDGWSFASAREPARFGAAEQRRSRGTEHALGGNHTTLCGIPEAQLVVWMHLFEPDGPQACADCRSHALEAPSVPCGQERLHDKLVSAPASPLQRRVLEALLAGAKIRIWISGPAQKMAVYANVDSLTDGAAAASDLLAAGCRLSVARVVQPSGEFVILMPEEADPVIAWSVA